MSSATDEKPDFTSVKPPSEKKGESTAKKPAADKSTPKPAPRRTRKPTLESELQDVFSTISVAILATGDMYCAEVVATQAEPLAKAWAELAQKHEGVRRVLERMMQGSAWSGVIIATSATVIPIAAHHGAWPKGFPMPFSFGIGPPPPPSPEVQNQGDQK